MTETEFSHSVSEILDQYESIGMLVHFRVNSGKIRAGRSHVHLARPGTPDRIVCIGGRFLGLEIKKPDGSGSLRGSQMEMKRLVERAGGIYVVIERLGQLHDLILTLYEESKGIK